MTSSCSERRAETFEGRCRSLEVGARRLGLTPKGWSETVRRVDREEDFDEGVASGLLRLEAPGSDERRAQRELRTAFRSSVKWTGRAWTVESDSKFRCSPLRLNPRKDILHTATSGSWSTTPTSRGWWGQYPQRFPTDVVAADAIETALAARPPYSLTVADLTDALDVCEPTSDVRRYRAALRSAESECVERGARLSVSSLSFRARRRSTERAMR